MSDALTPIEEYAATATRVEAQVRYLPSFYTGASYPNSLSRHATNDSR